jgi:hypothetical protein
MRPSPKANTTDTSAHGRLLAANRQRRRRARLRGIAPSVTIPKLPLQTAADCLRALEFAVSLSEREPFRAQSVIAAVKLASGLVQTYRAERAFAESGLAEYLGATGDEKAQ